MHPSTDRPTSKRFLRPPQIIRDRRFPRTRLYEDLARGAIRHVRLNRSILIEEGEFDAYVDRLSVGGAHADEDNQPSAGPAGGRAA